MTVGKLGSFLSAWIFGQVRQSFISLMLTKKESTTTLTGCLNCYSLQAYQMRIDDIKTLDDFNDHVKVLNQRLRKLRKLEKTHDFWRVLHLRTMLTARAHQLLDKGKEIAKKDVHFSGRNSGRFINAKQKRQWQEINLTGLG